MRLFVDPTPVTHSNLVDATQTIQRAKAAGLQVLLDFHYSDTFADPGRQDIPASLADAADTPALAQKVYDYTLEVLTDLNSAGLMPELVQVGNETNTNILRRAGDPDFPLNWARNAPLFNAGIAAVREAGRRSAIQPRVILHIAQPENIDFWFTQATTNGVTDFDIIGVSYYPSFSTTPLTGIGSLIDQWRTKFQRDILFVATAYPFTFDFADSVPNLLGNEALEPGFPAMPEGQRDYMIALTQSIIDHGGKGVISWEPAWIAANCPFAFGQGSSWENAIYFDFKKRNNVHAGIGWLSNFYTIK